MKKYYEIINNLHIVKIYVQLKFKKLYFENNENNADNLFVKKTILLYVQFSVERKGAP